MTTRVHFSDFSRVGKGYMFLNDVRCYIEVWHSVVWQEDKLKIFYPKSQKSKTNMSYSYAVGKNITEWHCEDAYMWCKLPHKACIDTAIAVAIAETGLKFFEESRKWLTKEEKEAAQLFALRSISRKDLGWLLKCDVCDLPQVFWEYAKSYGKEYDDYCARRAKEEREMAEKLNTPEGLKYLIRIAKMYGEHRPAISFIEEFVRVMSLTKSLLG